MAFTFSLSSRALYCGNKMIIITGNYDREEKGAKVKGSVEGGCGSGGC